MKRVIFTCFTALFLFSHLSTAAVLNPVTSDHTHTHQAAKGQSTTQPVDINHADVTQLTSLKGVGPAKANAIIAYRTKHGAFKTVSDLTNIRGIKAKTLARLQAKNPGRIVVNNS
ncbi:MAG: helix-hairpin-helix domain-containing protein [Gammaproteobacteria bacterium]|nr:helix-hairpin-helix domain-containing protein [Gammaproteobacteria bacterium]